MTFHYYAKPTTSIQGPGFAFDLDHEISIGSHYVNGQTYLCFIQKHEAGHTMISDEAGNSYLVGTISYDPKPVPFDPHLVCGPPLVSRRKQRPWKREI